jgi:outer membrane receptor protein involved in Fe transport
LAFAISALHGQTIPAAPTATDEKASEETVVLSPFEVSTDQDRGYMATSSLAGTRINTNLSDVGSAISVVTSEFLRDTGATDNRTLLQYTAGTEVGSLQGNFINAKSGQQDEGSTFTSPNTNTRVRGLTAADNTRNFFLTDIPWESYATDRVDIQRGPNSILFGMGSPAGIINTSTKTALFKNLNEAEFRYGSYGTTRATLDINRELLDNELAARLIFLRADNQYRQRPAYSLDKRLFSTLRYEPKFLNRDGMTTTFKANAEWGRVRSNNPRVITPIDYVTPWFDYMAKATYDPRTVQDNHKHYYADQSQYFPDNYGQVSRYREDGSANPDWQPWIGNFAQSFGGLLGFFQPGSTTPNAVELSEFKNVRGIGSNGAIDGSVGLPYSRRVSVDAYSTYAQDVGLEYSNFGLYKNKTLSDASIFDFYNNLLDGDNKQEWQNFRDLSASLSQTFMNNLFGYELAYDRQSYGNGQLQLMTDQKAGIYIDINSVGLDGKANPNVGRPFISDSGIYGNNANTSVRDSARFTAFLDYDFNRDRRGNWIQKALGRYLLSGLVSRDRYDTDARSFMRWGTADDYSSYISNTGYNIDANERSINPVVYLGDSLAGLTAASGAHIARAGDTIRIPAQVQMYNFDSTWNGAGVNPADDWFNTFTGQKSTQSENPANYVGWSNKAVNIYSYENGDKDVLTTGATLNRKISKSMAATIQAYFWDGAIVGTYGVRQDHVKSWSKNADEVAGRVDFTTYRLADDPDTVVTKNSPSWSVVAKLDKLIGGHLPFVDINVFYNKSQNFQVLGTRNDVYGRPFALPNGETVDKGILIATKDGKYSFKVNKFESTVKAASSTAGLNSWFLGAFMTWGSDAADSYTYRLGSTGQPSTANNTDTWHYVWQPMNGETQADADAKMNATLTAWSDLMAKIPQAYFDAWHIHKTTSLADAAAHTYTSPANLTITEDQISRGYEFEFTANPLPNWRITANAAKVEAIRNNVGGDALNELVGIVDNAMKNTAAGDMRIWWGGGDPSNLLKTMWNANFYSDYSRTRLSEGNVSPELRKWRFNIVSNYSFDRGFLKGAWVGVGYRWQDRIAIGYKPLPTSDPNVITFDLDHPYYGPSEDAVDFWIGYSRKLTEKINWRVQLNVRDAFKGNSLIPLTTQPDGSVAAWRIAPSQTWELSNTFTF